MISHVVIPQLRQKRLPMAFGHGTMSDCWRIWCPWIPRNSQVDHPFPNKHGSGVGRLTSFSTGAAGGKRSAEQVRMTRAWCLCARIWMNFELNLHETQELGEGTLVSCIFFYRIYWLWRLTWFLLGVNGTMEPVITYMLIHSEATNVSYRILQRHTAHKKGHSSWFGLISVVLWSAQSHRATCKDRKLQHIVAESGKTRFPAFSNSRRDHTPSLLPAIRFDETVRRFVHIAGNWQAWNPQKRFWTSVAGQIGHEMIGVVFHLPSVRALVVDPG